MTLRLAKSTTTCCALLVAALSAVPGTYAEGPDEVLVQVNGRTVTRADVQQRLELRLAALEQANLPPARLEQKRQEARDETLRDLYEEALILARADELGYKIDGTEVDREVVDIIGQPEFQRRIEREPIAERDRIVARIHQDVVKRLTVQEVFRREIQPNVELGEAEVRAFYDANPDEFRTPGRVRARAVVVTAASGRSGTDLQRVADDIRASVGAGRTLEEAAGPYIDVGLAAEPVELGWIGRGDVEPEIESALWSAPLGTAIEPFPAQGGLHVVQVTEREEGRQLSYDEIREELETRLQYARFSRELADYLYGLEQAYQVQADPAAVPTEAKAAAEPMRATPVAPIASGADRAELVEAAVQNWAAAWSAQDVNAYLSAYAPSFRPASGQSRAAWESERRDRLTRPAYIRVELSSLETRIEGDRAVATFRQKYSSDRFSDEVDKTLELAWQGGAWKIAAERSD